MDTRLLNYRSVDKIQISVNGAILHAKDLNFIIDHNKIFSLDCFLTDSVVSSCTSFLIYYPSASSKPYLFALSFPRCSYVKVSKILSRFSYTVSRYLHKNREKSCYMLYFSGFGSCFVDLLSNGYFQNNRAYSFRYFVDTFF